jgi:colicin import membrane protein
MIDLRMFYRSCSSFAVAALLVLPAAPVFAQATRIDPANDAVTSDSTSLTTRFPAGTIHSELLADQALEAAQKERASIEARYVAEQRACYQRFFVTSCIEASKERHRSTLQQVRPVEVEAEKFKRQLRVTERDQGLAEKRAQEEAEAPERAQRQRDSERAAAEKAEERVRQAAEAQASETEHAADAARRAAEHQERLQRADAEEAANARKRAENTAAYERKVRAAQEHQKEVEANKKAKALAK